jgi:hypothetical protein
MVIAFRRWCDAFTEGQGAPWSPIMGAPPITGALRRAPREEVLERRHSHVAHCAACTGALANTRRIRQLAEGAVAAFLLLAGGVARARGAALAAAAAAFAAARACTALEERMTVGLWTPPRNA